MFSNVVGVSLSYAGLSCGHICKNGQADVIMTLHAAIIYGSCMCTCSCSSMLSSACVVQVLQSYSQNRKKTIIKQAVHSSCSAGNITKLLIYAFATLMVVGGRELTYSTGYKCCNNYSSIY